jgi:DNA-binding SARP family transcriptional activator
MLRLKTFGQLTLTNEALPVAGAACQRNSLALLAILAAAGERATSRDRLLALLWPEVEAEKAGHRLAQVLYSLRREPGRPGVGSLGYGSAFGFQDPAQ